MMSDSNPIPAAGALDQADTRPGASEYTIASASVPLKAAVALPAEGEGPNARGKVAVFVAHGMGQQIPLQTLDEIAQGLRKQDPKWHEETPAGCISGSRLPKAKVAAIKVPGEGGQPEQWLQRVELLLGPEPQREVHVYESYWAPLTEGKVTLRNVMSFLMGAGLNGVRNGSQQFCRWLFGTYRTFDSPIRIVLYLLTTLAVVASLVVLNNTILLVAAARAPFGTHPDWLSNNLFGDLSTTLDGVLLSLLPLGIALSFSAKAAKARALQAFASLRQAVPSQSTTEKPTAFWDKVSLPAAVLALFGIVLGACALPPLLYIHIRSGGKADEVWHGVLGVSGFRVLGIAWLLLLVVAGVLLLYFLLRAGFKLGRGALHKLFVSHQPQTRSSHPLDKACAALFLVLLALVLGQTIYLLTFLSWSGFSFSTEVQTFWHQGYLPPTVRGLAWPLLVAVSAFVRKFLIQYLGDVAVYVTPYKLDGFYQLREDIRQCAYKVARAVYSQDYEEVFVVGHSLGSGVVYDTLNLLVNEDIAAIKAGKASLHVAARTPLLLTFGCPLDKFAFLFGTQKQRTTEAREALAATKQPLIQSYEFRPTQWINLWSRWDVISGNLDFYDIPSSVYDASVHDDSKLDKNSKHVQNVTDPNATTLFAAHTQYWDNPMLYGTLYDAIVKKTSGKHASDPPDRQAETKIAGPAFVAALGVIALFLRWIWPRRGGAPARSSVAAGHLGEQPDAEAEDEEHTGNR
jgi:hypothetical protein